MFIMKKVLSNVSNKQKQNVSSLNFSCKNKVYSFDNYLVDIITSTDINYLIDLKSQFLKWYNLTKIDYEHYSKLIKNSFNDKWLKMYKLKMHQYILLIDWCNKRIAKLEELDNYEI